jgi:hypothetical protein
MSKSPRRKAIKAARLRRSRFRKSMTDGYGAMTEASGKPFTLSIVRGVDFIARDVEPITGKVRWRL